MIIDNIQRVVRELSPDLQKEVEDYAKYLLEKKMIKKQSKLKLNWKGALKDIGKEYTSVELQHKSLEWWNEECI
jgi:hypothetical protein